MRSNRRDAVVCAGCSWKVLFDHSYIFMPPFREELTKEVRQRGIDNGWEAEGETEVETEGNR